jgi:hypothetical protein
MLPNFLVIGTPKGGTTSLYRYLRAHPQVFMPETKELRFFIEGNWILGREWYEQQFEGSDNAIAVGEATAAYTLYPELPGVPERVADLVPDARLIYLVRHPIERMRSHYLDRLIYHGFHTPIEEALVADPFYVHGSSYALQIEEYLDCFPREQLLILQSERLLNDRGETLRRIFDFIGVDPSWEDAVTRTEFHRSTERRRPTQLGDRIWHSWSYQRVRPLLPGSGKGHGIKVFQRRVQERQRTISRDLEHRLRDLVADDVARLYRYMDDSFDGWGIA